MITVCVNDAWIFVREGGYKDDWLSLTRAAGAEEEDETRKVVLNP